MDKTISGLKYKKVILFDGVCNLCNSFVQFIIKRDRQGVFYFASLQSAFGQELLNSFPEFQSLDTVLLLENGIIKAKSDAALSILKELPHWGFASVLFVFPLFFRDAVYNFVAKNRYRLFGKKSECMLPTPNQSARFLT